MAELGPFWNADLAPRAPARPRRALRPQRRVAGVPFPSAVRLHEALGALERWDAAPTTLASAYAVGRFATLDFGSALVLRC